MKCLKMTCYADEIKQHIFYLKPIYIFCKVQKTSTRIAKIVSVVWKNHFVSDSVLAPGLGLFACIASIK